MKLSYIISILLIIIFLFLFIKSFKTTKKTKKNHNKTKKDNLINYNIYLKLINNTDQNEEYYLSWKFNGYDKFDNFSYILKLLPYKNKQNLFILLNNKNIPVFLNHNINYQKNIMLEQYIRQMINYKLFITSEYNYNLDDFLELVTYDTNIYLIKKNISFLYLHIDSKNKLYFDKGINENIAKFSTN